LDLGADIVLHSTTKYIGGHSDVVGGCVIIRDEQLIERLKFLQNAAGAIPGPFDCFLTLRGIRTLALRMERHCDNAEEITQRLSKRAEVTRILYPGLASHPNHHVAASQMRRFGGMISIELEGGEMAARKFAAALKLFLTAESLGGVESLINHPWTMTHAAIPEQQRRDAGMTPGLVRLSVGIEDVEDLWNDIVQALKISSQ
jgi:cystathionine beta-lyase/cystathionine gamma-synthase